MVANYSVCKLFLVLPKVISILPSDFPKNSIKAFPNHNKEPHDGEEDMIATNNSTCKGTLIVKNEK